MPDTPLPPPRIYTDTSVIGGCFDVEFAEHSNRFFGQAKAGRIRLLISETVINEIATAPPQVRRFLADLPPECMEQVHIDERVSRLVNAYLRAGILTPRWEDDATHVAAATIARADAIVSWNFKHIVRLDKINAYNQVNEENGYHLLTILSPTEVNYGDED